MYKTYESSNNIGWNYKIKNQFWKWLQIKKIRTNVFDYNKEWNWKKKLILKNNLIEK